MEFQPDAEWLGRILETIPEFVIVIDRAGRIRYINRVEPGFDRQEVVGTPSAEFLFPYAVEAQDAAFEAAFQSGQKQDFEVELDLPDDPAWYRCEVHPLWQEDHIVALLLKATNITEIKAAEESVARLQKLLPICSWCDRIQGQDGAWLSIERYLKKVEATDVTHALCPDCYERQAKELTDEEDGRTGGSAV